METELEAKQSRSLSKKTRFLANPEVRRWYDNIARGSLNTADAYQRKLRLFCETHGMTPLELAELGQRDPKAVEDLLADHVTMMEQKIMPDGRTGHAPDTINGLVKAVKSWLAEYRVKIERKIRIKNSGSTPTLDRERLPTSEELTELFNRSSLRTALIMAIENKSGVRPEVLGDVTGDDGLRIKDLPDIAIVGGLATAIRTPPKVVVRKSLSKVAHEYFTFLTPMATKLLTAYLNQRIMDGEALGPDSPVIAPSKHCKYRGDKLGKPCLTTTSIRKCVREVTRPRFKEWRSNYVHRRFFDTQLIVAEGQGKVPHNFIQFWMGHTGDIENLYTTNKGILPPQLVNEMREAFKRCVELLDMEETKQQETEKQKQEIREKVEGLTPEMLSKVLELMNNGKTGESRESLPQMMQSSSYQRVGSTKEPYQTERSSSENRFRYPQGDEPLRARSLWIN